jgi:hypothetical protein
VVVSVTCDFDVLFIANASVSASPWVRSAWACSCAPFGSVVTVVRCYKNRFEFTAITLILKAIFLNVFLGWDRGGPKD